MLRFKNFFVCFGCGRKLDAIQKRAAYFGCIAALDGNSEAHAPAEPPFSSWPASSAPPRWSRARIGAAGTRRSSASWRTAAAAAGEGRAHRRSRCWSGDENRDRRTCDHLHTGKVSRLSSSGPARTASCRLCCCSGVIWQSSERVVTHVGHHPGLQTSCRS